jgi:hypothetical protein
MHIRHPGRKRTAMQLGSVCTLCIYYLSVFGWLICEEERYERRETYRRTDGRGYRERG